MGNQFFLSARRIVSWKHQDYPKELRGNNDSDSFHHLVLSWKSLEVDEEKGCQPSIIDKPIHG
jgi:hypothetical protein